ASAEPKGRRPLATNERRELVPRSSRDSLLTLLPLKSRRGCNAAGIGTLWRVTGLKRPTRQSGANRYRPLLRLAPPLHPSAAMTISRPTRWALGIIAAVVLVAFGGGLILRGEYHTTQTARRTFVIDENFTTVRK